MVSMSGAQSAFCVFATGQCSFSLYSSNQSLSSLWFLTRHHLRVIDSGIADHPDLCVDRHRGFSAATNDGQENRMQTYNENGHGTQ